MHFPNNVVKSPVCFCLKSTLSFIAPLFSFPAGLITKVPEEINSTNVFQNPLPVQHQQYLDQDKQIPMWFIPLDVLPVLVSEGLSEAAPSFSLSAEASDSFSPVCLATVAGFLQCIRTRL